MKECFSIKLGVFSSSKNSIEPFILLFDLVPLPRLIWNPCWRRDTDWITVTRRTRTNEFIDLPRSRRWGRTFSLCFRLISHNSIVCRPSEWCNSCSPPLPVFLSYLSMNDNPYPHPLVRHSLLTPRSLSNHWFRNRLRNEFICKRKGFYLIFHLRWGESGGEQRRTEICTCHFCVWIRGMSRHASPSRRRYLNETHSH